MESHNDIHSESLERAGMPAPAHAPAAGRHEETISREDFEKLLDMYDVVAFVAKWRKKNGK